MIVWSVVFRKTAGRNPNPEKILSRPAFMVNKFQPYLKLLQVSKLAPLHQLFWVAINPPNHTAPEVSMIA